MKKRIVKKIAKRFMADKNYQPFGTYEDYYGYVDGQPTYKIYVRFPYPVIREIYKIAKKQGWDGCHWSDPTIIEIIRG